MVSTFKNRSKQSLYALLLLPISLHIAAAFPVGPQLPEERQREGATGDEVAPYPRLNIPKLDLAVVVIDPGLNESDDRMRELGVWPEIRKIEGIRSAYRIKEAIERLNQFERVTVAPSTAVSADLYLVGGIVESTSEIMTISWMLVDARGAIWWKKSIFSLYLDGRLHYKHQYRVRSGWHERFYTPGKDAFQPLWDLIADYVYNRLTKFAKRHEKTTKRNQSRKKRGRPELLSELDEITHTRDLVLARFFAPQLYGDAIIKINKHFGEWEWEINYLPSTTTEDWLIIQAFAQKDQEVASLYDKQYTKFFNSVNPSYEKWLNDLFPYARQMRLEQRSATFQRLVGLALIAAAGTDSSVSSAVAKGEIVGSVLFLNSLLEQEDFQRNLNVFNEMSRDYHDSFAPVNVKIRDETITLQGKADTQFGRWRAVVRELYEREQADAFAIQVLDNE